MKNYPLVLILISIFIYSCKQENSKITNKETTIAFEKVWETDSVFKTPESCIHDTKRNKIYVSNVNLNPRTKDYNGFISLLNTDGKIEKLKWIEGLSAPKGMGIFKDKLFVTDIDAIIEIDINTSKITNKFQIEGALMLNDISISEDGTIYVSAMDTNRIYTLKNGKINLFLDNIVKPNGLLLEKGKMMMASLGEGKFYEINLDTKKMHLIAEGIGKGDGVVKTSKNEYIVSDWRGEIFKIENGKPISLLRTIESDKQTADIGIITEKNIILIPTFFDNKVVAYQLK